MTTRSPIEARSLIETWHALIRQSAVAESAIVRAASLAEAERVAAAIEKLPPSGPKVAEAKLDVILWQANRAFDRAGHGHAARPDLVSV